MAFTPMLNISERQAAQFQRDVDEVLATGREPFFNDGNVLLDFYVDNQPPPRNTFTFSIRPTPTIPYFRRLFTYGARLATSTLHLPLHLTAGKRDPVEYYSKILTCNKIVEVMIDIAPTNVALQHTLGVALRPDWHIVRLFFGRDRGIAITDDNSGDDVSSDNVLLHYAVFPTEMEFTLRWSLGNKQQPQICRIPLATSASELEQLYIDSRKTQFSFCLIVSRYNFLNGGSMHGARMRTDYAALNALQTQWSDALQHSKVVGWYQRACDELKDMRWVLILSGPWRTRKVAKQTICEVFARQSEWHIDEAASELFEPRAPNFILTTASLGNGRQRTYKFARNPLRHFTWRKVHAGVLDAVLVLAQTNLPPYVILHIIDQHERVWPIEEIIKVRLIESVVQSIRRVRARWQPFDMQMD